MSLGHTLSWERSVLWFQGSQFGVTRTRIMTLFHLSNLISPPQVFVNSLSQVFSAWQTPI